MGKTLIKQGDIYNYWTVIGKKPEKIGTRSKWLCKCKCGAEKYVDGAGLRNGSSKSCGCYSREVATRRNRHNLEGQVFGLLTVIKERRYTWPNGSNIIWECQCECGNVILVKTNELTQNKKNPLWMSRLKE